MDVYDIEERLPKRDHAVERDINVVPVMVVKLRHKLGADAIETMWGKVYRLSDTLAAALRAGSKLEVEVADQMGSQLGDMADH